MTNTDILLEDLEDVLDDATSMPMTKKSLVDVDKIKTIIEDIRLNTPQETKQAKAIVDSRNSILEEAKRNAMILLPRRRRRQESLLRATKSRRRRRPRRRTASQRQRKRAMLMLRKHRIRLQRFWAMPQRRQMRCSQTRRTRAVRCLLP